MKIETKDKIVQEVLKKMDQRSLVGQKKYGATMMQEIENEDKNLERFIDDVQEEMMDAILYLQAAKHCATRGFKGKTPGSKPSMIRSGMPSNFK